MRELNNLEINAVNGGGDDLNVCLGMGAVTTAYWFVFNGLLSTIRSESFMYCMAESALQVAAGWVGAVGLYLGYNNNPKSGFTLGAIGLGVLAYMLPTGSGIGR